jgi:hypothetical protein
MEEIFVPAIRFDTTTATNINRTDLQSILQMVGVQGN